MPDSVCHADLIATLRAAGVCAGQVVFCAGEIKGRLPAEVWAAFQEVIGPEGTLCVPTFTHSFSQGQIYDPDQTPGQHGPWSEWVRQRPDAQRSRDPIFSVAAVGARAVELTQAVSLECFGPESFWARLEAANGFVCALGGSLPETVVTYFEKKARVSYRFDKLFTGSFSEQGILRKGAVLSFVRDANEADTEPSLDPLQERLLAKGLARLGMGDSGEILGVSMTQLGAEIESTLAAEPAFLIAAGRHGRQPRLERKAREFALNLPVEASMREMVEALWRLPRDILSDGYDAALEALAGQMPMTIHRYPTGMQAWTWVVPEKWTCHEARLETLAGEVLIDYAADPLHVVSYSLPKDGVVSREELLKHLHVHPFLPEAVPFMFKYYERDWGLCCSQRLRDSLEDETYRVTIRSDFTQGSLKVGEVLVRGQSEDCVVLCAHLCHPGQVADDLSGVVAGLEIMRALSRRADLHYTYRLLILPETIGSVAWLSQNEALIPQMKAGLFLEMVSLPNPPALQLSFAGDTGVDRCFTTAMQAHDPVAWTGAFRTLIGNDERQFNAPGVRVPMLSLSRILPRTDAHWPYPQYHSNADNLDHASWSHLEDTVTLVLKMLDALEAAPRSEMPVQTNKDVAEAVPLNLFKGEVFCSRYGLHIDFSTNPEGNRAFFNILYLIDGQHSVTQIAERCGVSVTAVEGVLAELARHRLVA